MLLDAESSLIVQIAYPLISGIGIGMLFHAPYQVFIRALKSEELATGTSAFFLVRFTGATVGLVSGSSFAWRSLLNDLQAVAGAIFYGRASRLLTELPMNQSSSSIDYSALRTIEPLSLRQHVVHVISTSIQVCLDFNMPCTP